MNSHAWFDAHFASRRPEAIAALTRQFRNVDMAEEVFATACERALKAWPARGFPNDPFAWLLTTARNAGIDIIRRGDRRTSDRDGQVEIRLEEDTRIAELDHEGLRDDVLRLLFVCCHPKLAPQDQLALALKIVAGLSIEEIAQAFLVKPKTMEKRITRAKKTITSANTPFEAPSLVERKDRFEAVSLMLYLLFNEGWSASSGEIQIKSTLCHEAIRLARLLLSLFPGMSELMGLLALFLFQHSRRNARIDIAGQLVVLDDQDRALWDQGMIAEGRAILDKALRHRMPGPFQIQAAIASVHAQTKTSDETDWQEIERLYNALYAIEPTPIVRLNHAAAIAKVSGAQAALDVLDTIEGELLNYRWFHMARAALYDDLSKFGDAKAAYAKTLELDPTEPEQMLLRQKIKNCETNLKELSDFANPVRP